MEYWDPGHRYRFRTWLPSHLPWWLINLGAARKGEDCAKTGAEHWWYNIDGETSGCYHCIVERAGRLWQTPASE